MCNCNNPTPCNCIPPTECDCPTFLGSDCVNFTEDLVGSAINKNQTLTATIVALDAYISAAIADIDVKGNLISIGTGAEVYKGINNAGRREIRSIQSQSLAVTENTDNISIDMPYKVYTAILNQTGTAAPVATVLTNTTGATLTWTRVGAGQYVLTASTAVFTAAKTTLNQNLNFTTGFTIGSGFVGNHESTTVCNFLSNNATMSVDDILQDAFLEIKIYP